jgi:SAM-dependent methyltransferase
VQLTSMLFIIKDLQRNMLKKYSRYLNGRVLDIGCGTKPYRSYLGECGEYVGMDNDAAVKPDIVGDINNMPFPEEYFDSVLCTEVLEHLTEPEAGIRQINRVLKKNGYLYLTIPQEWCLHYEPRDYFRFTKYGIKYLLEKNGFEILAIERLGGVFSLVGQRLVDVIWNVIMAFLKPVLTLRCAERVSTIICLPTSIMFYTLGKIGDNIDKRDAICWAVLARK